MNIFLLTLGLCDISLCVHEMQVKEQMAKEIALKLVSKKVWSGITLQVIEESNLTPNFECWCNTRGYNIFIENTMQYLDTYFTFEELCYLTKRSVCKEHRPSDIKYTGLQLETNVNAIITFIKYYATFYRVKNPLPNNP